MLKSSEFNLKNSKKYILIYITTIITFIIATFQLKNYLYFKTELILIGLIVILGTFTILYSFNNKKELHKVAFLIIIIFGLLMVFLSPPMAYPDEATHFTRSELLTTGVLYPENTENGYLVNDYYFNLNQAKQSLTILNNNFNDSIDNSKSYWPTCTQSPFYSYLPSALGIIIAKLCNLTAIWALWLGRLANLLFYGGIASIAIKKATKYKLPLLVVATMPLTISQISSMSYDAFIITLTILAIGYLIYMYKNKVRNKDLAIFFISCLLISLIKPPYILLSLLILIVPKENFKNKNTYIYSIVTIAILFLATFFSVGHLFDSFFTTSKPLTSSTVNSSISLAGQLNHILSNPTTLIVFPIKSFFNVFITNLSYYHYADFNGLKFLNLAYFIFFTIFSIFYQHKIDLSKIKRGFLLLIFLAIYFGMFFILYLQWTPVGANTILGIQGRYFLPALPLIPLIFNINNEKFENKDFLTITLIISFLAGLFILMIAHYY